MRTTTPSVEVRQPGEVVEARAAGGLLQDRTDGAVGHPGRRRDLAELAPVGGLLQMGAQLVDVTDHAAILSENRHGRQVPLSEPRHFPTNGKSGKFQGVDEIEIFADNPRCLMEQACKDGHSIGTKLGLSKASGVSRAQIIAYLDQRTDQRQAPGVDTVGRIARAFGMQAWQLLVPGISATNPPVIHITDDEKRLYRRLLYVQREYQRGKADVAVPEPDGPDRHRARKRSSKSHK